MRVSWAIPDITDEDVRAVADVVRSGWVSGTGPVKQEFERAFARKVGAKYAIAVCNGTMSLVLALLALRQKYQFFGVPLAIPTYTFIATASAASMVMDGIELVDCKSSTININPKLLPTKVRGCEADIPVMPVDVGGCPVDYDAMRDRILVADSAESVGAEYKNKKIGSIALMTSFSFHATKIITTGEGGMVTTNDAKLYDYMLSFANQGYKGGRAKVHYEHSRIGYNFRMTEMQAALGLSQLRRLDYYLRKRRELANVYRDILGDRVDYQRIPRYCKSSNFLFPILVDADIRDEIVKKMLKRGIGVKVSWKPVHLQPAYRHLHHKSHCPIAEKIYSREISLPMHNVLSEEEVKYVAGIVKRLVR